MTDVLTKACTKCGETKPLSEFYLKNGKSVPRCKPCMLAVAKQWRTDHPEEQRALKAATYQATKAVVAVRGRAYRAANAEEIAARNKKWYAANRESQLASMREYYAENREEMNAQSRAYHAANPETVKAAAKRWRDENRDYIAEKSREAYASTPSIRIRQSISTSVRRALSGDKESKRTFEILGYTLEELMAHLEAQFLSGMTWENYEYRGWHIDHKRPQSSFRFRSIEDPEFKQCWALSNLQPMWWLDNISKGAKWVPPTPSNDNASEALGRAG